MGFPCTLVDQIEIIKTMILRTAKATDILAATEKTKCEDFKVLRSLASFPRGRMLVEQAKAHGTAMLAEQEKVREHDTLVSALQMTLDKLAETSEGLPEAGLLAKAQEAFQAIETFPQTGLIARSDR